MGHEQTFVRVEGGEAYQDFGLQVELGEEIKILPALRVGTDTEPATIFLWDPNKDPSLIEPSATEMAKLVVNGLVLTLGSDKSVPVVKRAVVIYNQPAGTNAAALSVIARGSTKAAIEAEEGGTAVCGRSIKGEDRWFSLGKVQSNMVRILLEQEEIVTIFDDVRSSGATEQAIIKALIVNVGKSILKPQYRGGWQKIVELIAAETPELPIKIDMELISDQIRFAYLLEEYPLLPGGEIPPMASHVNAAGRILCLLGELEDHNLQI